MGSWVIYAFAGRSVRESCPNSVAHVPLFHVLFIIWTRKNVTELMPIKWKTWRKTRWLSSRHKAPAARKLHVILDRWSPFHTCSLHACSVKRNLWEIPNTFFLAGRNSKYWLLMLLSAGYSEGADLECTFKQCCSVAEVIIGKCALELLTWQSMLLALITILTFLSELKGFIWKTP